MIELRTPGELDAMRVAGAVVAEMLAAVRAAAAPGVRLTQLDEVARDVLARNGAGSPFLGYQPLNTTPPFPGVVCLSVNDVALHGIPTSEPLQDGDLLSVDAGAVLDGWVGDAAITFPVGSPRPEDPALVATAERALEAGIAAAVVGNRVGDISAAIGVVGRAGGDDDYRVDADGWTLRSADGSRAAHVEHTVAVTDDGPRILTAPR